MSLRCLLGFITRCTFLAGTTLDLTSSQNISLTMPRLKNSADSPQPRLKRLLLVPLTVVLLGLRRRYKPRQSGLHIIGAIPALQEHVSLWPS